MSLGTLAMTVSTSYTASRWLRTLPNDHRFPAHSSWQTQVTGLLSSDVHSRASQTSAEALAAAIKCLALAAKKRGAYCSPDKSITYGVSDPRTLSQWDSALLRLSSLEDSVRSRIKWNTDRPPLACCGVWCEPTPS